MSGNYVWPCFKIPSFLQANLPVVMELSRMHGKTVNFVGVVFDRGHNNSHFEKQRVANMAASQVRRLGAQGVIISWEGGGNAATDAMLTIQTCERWGIKATAFTFEFGGPDGTEGVLLVDDVPEAKFLVSGGSIEKPTRIPKVARVSGGDVLRLRKETGGGSRTGRYRARHREHDAILLRRQSERRGWTRGSGLLMEGINDLIVVGAGTAGLSAGVYGARSQALDPDTGPQAPGRTGPRRRKKWRTTRVSPASSAAGSSWTASATTRPAWGAKIEKTDVLSLAEEGGIYVVKTKSGDFRARSLILAPGCEPRRLGIPGEKEFAGSGVSYCATCDAELYDGAVVVGGSGAATPPSKRRITSAASPTRSS